MSSKTTQLILSAVLLIVGGYIYVAYRTDKLAMFRWFSTLHMDGLFYSIRGRGAIVKLPAFIKYCLPNGLWITSYLLAVNALVVENKLIWVLSLPSIAILFEFLQVWHIIPGTFDFGDLICLFVPVLIYFVYYSLHNEKST